HRAKRRTLIVASPIIRIGGWCCAICRFKIALWRSAVTRRELLQTKCSTVLRGATRSQGRRDGQNETPSSSWRGPWGPAVPNGLSSKGATSEGLRHLAPA